MQTPRKFCLTGRDPYGNNAVVQTDSRDTAEQLLVSWRKAGFINVMIAEPIAVADNHRAFSGISNTRVSVASDAH